MLVSLFERVGIVIDRLIGRPNDATDNGDIVHVFGRCNAPGVSHSECFQADHGLIVGVLAGMGCASGAAAAGATGGLAGGVAVVACGAFAGAVGQAASNAQYGHPLLAGTGRASLIGAGTGLLFHGGGAILNRVTGRIVLAPGSTPELAWPSAINNAGRPVRSFVTEADATYYRVYSGDNTVGGFLTSTPPGSSADAISSLALPPGNQATFIQEVFVPSGTRLQSSLATEAFGQPGGALQFQLLDQIPRSSFGQGVPLR